MKRKKTFFLPSFDGMVRAMMETSGHTITADPKEKWDCLLFVGGEDICPLLYGERLLPKTKISLARDQREIRAFKSCPTFKPKVGICRGAQLLNVLSGGSLWQDVNNHAGVGYHDVDVVKSGKVSVTSTHHQMMIPTELGTMVATSDAATDFESDAKVIKDRPKAWDNPEIVWYEHTASLCFQPHPEYKKGDCRDLFLQCLDETVLAA